MLAQQPGNNLLITVYETTDAKLFIKLKNMLRTSFEFMYRDLQCYYNKDGFYDSDVGWTNLKDIVYFDTIEELLNYMDDVA